MWATKTVLHSIDEDPESNHPQMTHTNQPDQHRGHSDSNSFRDNNEGEVPNRNPFMAPTTSFVTPIHANVAILSSLAMLMGSEPQQRLRMMCAIHPARRVSMWRTSTNEGLCARCLVGGGETTATISIDTAEPAHTQQLVAPEVGARVGTEAIHSWLLKAVIPIVNAMPVLNDFFRAVQLDELSAAEKSACTAVQESIGRLLQATAGTTMTRCFPQTSRAATHPSLNVVTASTTTHEKHHKVENITKEEVMGSREAIVAPTTQQHPPSPPRTNDGPTTHSSNAVLHKKDHEENRNDLRAPMLTQSTKTTSATIAAILKRPTPSPLPVANRSLPVPKSQQPPPPPSPATSRVMSKLEVADGEKKPVDLTHPNVTAAISPSPVSGNNNHVAAVAPQHQSKFVPLPRSARVKVVNTEVDPVDVMVCGEGALLQSPPTLQSPKIASPPSLPEATTTTIVDNGATTATQPKGSKKTPRTQASIPSTAVVTSTDSPSTAAMPLGKVLQPATNNITATDQLNANMRKGHKKIVDTVAEVHVDCLTDTLDVATPSITEPNDKAEDEAAVIGTRTATTTSLSSPADPTIAAMRSEPSPSIMTIEYSSERLGGDLDESHVVLGLEGSGELAEVVEDHGNYHEENEEIADETQPNNDEGDEVADQGVVETSNKKSQPSVAAQQQQPGGSKSKTNANSNNSGGQGKPKAPTPSSSAASLQKHQQQTKTSTTSTKGHGGNNATGSKTPPVSTSAPTKPKQPSQSQSSNKKKSSNKGGGAKDRNMDSDDEVLEQALQVQQSSPANTALDQFLENCPVRLMAAAPLSLFSSLADFIGNEERRRGMPPDALSMLMPLGVASAPHPLKPGVSVAASPRLQELIDVWSRIFSNAAAASHIPSRPTTGASSLPTTPSRLGEDLLQLVASGAVTYSGFNHTKLGFSLPFSTSVQRLCEQEPQLMFMVGMCLEAMFSRECGSIERFLRWLPVDEFDTIEVDNPYSSIPRTYSPHSAAYVQAVAAYHYARFGDLYAADKWIMLAFKSDVVCKDAMMSSSSRSSGGGSSNKQGGGASLLDRVHHGERRGFLKFISEACVRTGWLEEIRHVLPRLTNQSFYDGAPELVHNAVMAYGVYEPEATMEAFTTMFPRYYNKVKRETAIFTLILARFVTASGTHGTTMARSKTMSAAQDRAAFTTFDEEIYLFLIHEVLWPWVGKLPDMIMGADGKLTPVPTQQRIAPKRAAQLVNYARIAKFSDMEKLEFDHWMLTVLERAGNSNSTDVPLIAGPDVATTMTNPFRYTPREREMLDRAQRSVQKFGLTSEPPAMPASDAPIIVNYTFLIVWDRMEIVANISFPDGRPKMSIPSSIPSIGIFALFTDSALMRALGNEQHGNAPNDFGEHLPYHVMAAALRSCEERESNPQLYRRCSEDLEICLEMCYEIFIRPIRGVLGLDAVVGMGGNREGIRARGDKTHVLFMGRGIIDSLPFHAFYDRTSKTFLVEQCGLLTRVASTSYVAHARAAAAIHVAQKPRTIEKAVIYTATATGGTMTDSLIPTSCTNIMQRCPHGSVVVQYPPTTTTTVAALESGGSSADDASHLKSEYLPASKILPTTPQDTSKRDTAMSADLVSYFKHRNNGPSPPATTNNKACNPTGAPVILDLAPPPSTSGSSAHVLPNLNFDDLPCVAVTQMGVGRPSGEPAFDETRLGIHRVLLLSGASTVLIPWRYDNSPSVQNKLHDADDDSLLVMEAALRVVHEGPRKVFQEVRRAMCSLIDAGRSLDTWAAFALYGVVVE